MTYSKDDLRAIWDFCRHDFEQFLDLMLWLEQLPDPARAQQLESARYLRERKAGKR